MSRPSVKDTFPWDALRVWCLAFAMHLLWVFSSDFLEPASSENKQGHTHWRHPIRYQNNRVPKCRFFKTQKSLLCWYPSVLISLWVLLKKHRNRYQNKRVPKWQVFKIQKACHFENHLLWYPFGLRWAHAENPRRKPHGFRGSLLSQIHSGGMSWSKGFLGAALAQRATYCHIRTLKTVTSLNKESRLLTLSIFPKRH